MSCIEFMGCTSAGKSTLVRQILQICHSEGVHAYLGEDFLLNRFHLSWIDNQKIRIVLINVTAMLVALFNGVKYRDFNKFAFRRIAHQQIPWQQKLYVARNILKMIGTYEIAHSRDNNHDVVLLDEGPLQSSNGLFVSNSILPPLAELSEFMQVVPFPDAVVYIHSPSNVLIQRTLARGHKRIRSGELHDVERFIESAITIFERLLQEPALQGKLFIVNNHSSTLSKADPILLLKNFILSTMDVDWNKTIKGLNSESHFPSRNSRT